MATRKKADICIIGGGLTGLAVAAQLERAGLDYVIIESQSEAGGFLRGQFIDEKQLWLDFGLKSIPVGGELASNPLMKFKETLGLDIGVESWSEQPKTWSNNGPVDFMGFGEAKNRMLVEELSYYTQVPRLMVAGGWHNMIAKLLEIIPQERIHQKSYVTKINVSEDAVTSLVLNGETEFTAQKYVFTLSPLTLRDLLPQGALSGKTIQRIARTTPLTAVSLDLVTGKSVTPAKNVFVFQENSKEKNEDPFFVIGQFVGNVDPIRCASTGAQLSTWMTFVDPESLEDDEAVSKIIKTMKKLIKKAFPELIDGKPWERLLVIPAALGQFEQLTLEENLTVPGLDNLWICSGRNPGERRNIGSALECALTVGRELSTESVAVAEAEAKAETETVTDTEASPISPA